MAPPPRSTPPAHTPGTVTVTCNVVDDLGKQATATTSVGITTPPPPPVPPAPSTRSLCAVSFDRDRKRPVRVDNEAKGCLDDIALTLNRESSARLVIVGHHAEDEQPDAAAQRALNVEQYLIDEKGIDPSRIELRTGGTTGRSVDNILVPAGATFDTGQHRYLRQLHRQAAAASPTANQPLPSPIKRFAPKRTDNKRSHQLGGSSARLLPIFFNSRIALYAARRAFHRHPLRTHPHQTLLN